MKLVTLNLQWGGEDRTDSILDYLIGEDADFLVLGEYADDENGQKIKDTLTNDGFSYQMSDDNRLGVLVASKHNFTVIKRERRLVGIELSEYNLRVLGVYVPTGSKDKNFKDAVWQKILKFADENKDTPCIITGDFNSCNKDDSMNRTEYSAAELNKLRDFGWIDSWSQYNNDEDTIDVDNQDTIDDDKQDTEDVAKRYTWYSKYGNGFRFDYAFLSPELRNKIGTMHVFHDSKKREEEMTDHSPLVMEFSL